MTDWGSVPQWLALGGVLLAVASYIAGRWDVVRDNAAKVYVIITAFQIGTGRADGPGAWTKARIHNGSALPIYDAALSAWEWGARRSTWRLRKHSAWMTGEQVTGCVFPTISPGGDSDEEELFGLHHPSREDPKPESIRPPLMLVFRDGNGRRWVRWPDGRLNRVWRVQRHR
jgi:hypothetical protein